MSDTTCKCLPIEQTMNLALTGKPVPACRMHGTFGYEGHQTDEELTTDAVALNSQALEDRLSATLGAAVDKSRRADHLHDTQPNI